MTIYDDAAKKLTNARSSARAAVTQATSAVNLLAPTQSEAKPCAGLALAGLKAVDLQLTEALGKVKILTPAGAVPTQCLAVPQSLPPPIVPPEPPAATVGIISGSVSGLTGATVTIVIVGTGHVVVTGAGGSYSIPSVPPGTYSVTAAKVGYVTQTASGVAVTAGQTTTRNFTLLVEAPEPPSSGADRVVYPDANREFICGAQLVHGSSLNPWAFFDTNGFARGLVHGNAYPGAQPYEDHYYDLTLCLYIEYYRTGDSQFLTLARAVGDSWYGSEWIQPFSNSNISPRAAGYSGLMLRALDGRPEIWAGITTLAREQYTIWLGNHLADAQVYEGIRDGGLLLRGLAEFGKCHPDAGVRAEFTGYALAAARDYYARLQNADGGWYWPILGFGFDGYDAGQAFMVGMLLEGMVSTHRLTGDATVRASILAATDFLWTKGYDRSAVTNLSGVLWRAMRYFVVLGQPLTVGGSGLLYGSPDGAIRDARQLNPTCIHAFGYAYQLTGDAKYKTQGDDLFSASYGKGQGPGSDAYYCLADYVAKNYNQCGRSSGRYLAERL